MKRSRPSRVAPPSRLRFEPLEDRTNPVTIAEVEPNNTFAGAQNITVPSGDILTTPAADWLTITGGIGLDDADYFKFTLTQQAGVFFDVDAQGTGLSSLDSKLTLVNSAQATVGGPNGYGFDFLSFKVPETNQNSPVQNESDATLYADLSPGTYAIRVEPGFQFANGAYHLRILADTTYLASPPVYSSNPGAADTLYLDYDGHSATDSWGTYTAAPYDFGNTPGQWSPGERLAIRNTWLALAEDFVPFNVNITTAPAPATMVAGQSYRMVITNSTGSVIGIPGPAGIAWGDSYGVNWGSEWRTAFVFSGQMHNYQFSNDNLGFSGDVVAKSHEIASVAAHEFGHALGLGHYQIQASEGSATVLPLAIMAWRNEGLNKARWATGTTRDEQLQGGPPSTFQTDMAVISNATNTFGYRADAHGATTGTATVLAATGNTYTTTGIIEQVPDADWFRISASGATTITLDVSEYYGNLDAILRLRDSAGNIVETANPSGQLGATITRTLAAGTYYLEVKGTEDPVYAKVGQYSVRVNTTVLAPPALTGIETAALAYTENQSLAVTGTLAVSDPDSPNLTGATVTISAGYANGQDFLDFTNQGAISGSYASGTLTLSGTATLAAYETALRSVQYRNSSENPSTAARTVAFRVTDPDGNQSNIATRTVNVTAVNDVPVADDDAYSTNEDVQLVVPVATGVLDGDTDPDGTLTAVLVNNVTNGTLALNANGSFTYTPNANYNGTDTFTYRASDGVATSNLATVTITVNAVNDAPVADNDSYTTDEDTPLTVAAPGVLDGDTDVEGSTLTAAVVAGPANGSLTLNTNGSFTYTPNANYNGTDSFTYRANDGAANSNTATVTITVNSINDIPVADNDSYATDEDVQLTVPVATGVLDGDTDADGTPLTAVLVSTVQHGTLALNANGSFTYTPNANFNGTDTFTYRANDGTANSNTATVTITVNAVNDAPVADNDAYATNEDVQLVVAAPGVLDGDTDVEGSPLTAAVVTGPANGSLTLNSNGSFTYTPNANYNGTDSFTYRANDGAANSNTATVTITVNAVNDAPVADNDAYATNEDVPLVVAAPGVLDGDVDVDGNPLTAAVVAGPANGSLTLNSNGSFTYTPNANYNGTDSFTYRANDGTTNSNTATVTLTVNAVNDPPVADNEAYTTDEDTPLTVATPGVLDGDTDVEGSPLTAAVVANPANGSLTLNSNGSFTYTPNANFNGTDSFTYRANDGAANSNTATVTITVNSVNDIPVADNDSYSTNEDVPLTVPVATGVLDGDTDADGTPLTAVLVTDVQHGTLALNANGSFVYTPAANYHGPDSFTYRASDGTATSNLATVTLTVNAVNDAPVADNDAYATNEDTPLTIAAPGVLDGDTDVEGSPLTAAVVANPANGSLTLNSNGSFTYTPNANYNGTDSFTYRANDGAANSNTATVTITVNSVNDIPVADNDAYATNEDVQLVVAAPGVLDGDVDVDGNPLTAAVVTNPANGSLTLNSNGSFTYTPNANYNGTDSFTYRANDGTANSNTATVTLTVNSVNDAPVADNEAFSTNEDTPLTVAAPGVLDGDTDVEGSPLTAAVVAGPANGALTLNSNGSFTYTPNANYHGTDSFTYRANDGAANSNTATVTITVNPINDAPVADNDAYSTNEDTPLTIAAATGVLDGDTDAEGTTLTATLVADVQHGTLTLSANGSFVYTPAANYNGTDSFTYRASDGTLTSNLATVTLTINAVNDVPVADNDSYSTNEDTPLTVAAPGVLDGDTDVEGSPLTATVVAGPANGALTLNSNGSFTYTPAANFHGTDSFTYRANDGAANSNTATVTITVNPVNDAPVADNDAYATNEDTQLTVAVPGVLDGDTDAEGTALTVALVDNVQHGTLALNANGSFVYTPAANYNGPDTFTYRASDGSLTSNLATVTLTVNAVNDAPVADNDAYATNEDTPLTVAVATGVLDGDTDVEGSTLTAAVVTGPANGSLTLNANGSFTYTPNANYNGTDSFTYRASDGALTSNLATVTLTVNAVNDAPVADNDSYATNEDVQLVVATPGVLDGDTDVEGSPLTAAVVAGPANGSLTLNSNGSFTYTPNANFNGTDTFTYRANDGAANSNTATVTLTVNAVNDAPVADNDAYSTNEDVQLVITAPGVLDGDTDVEGSTLTAAVVTNPANGSLTLNSNGSFTYTPNANYNGTDTFTYRANDGTANSNTATVTITVNAVNDAPVADNDAYATNEDVQLVVAVPGVLDGDTDVEGSTLTAAVVTNPANGSLTLNANGSFTYTPNANFNGTDSFTYRANDGTTNSNTATVTLTVNAVNDVPVADNDAYSTNEDVQLVVATPGVLDGDTDVEGSPLTAAVVAGPANGTLALNANGSFTYTPNANYNGTDTFTYRANDGAANSNTATVTLTVNAVNDAPVADNDAYATNEDVPLVVATPGVLDGDTDVEGSTLTAALVAGPANGSLTLNSNGSFTYTPNANFNGTDSFTYRANDGAANSNTATVTLTVNAVNDVPVADNDSFATNEDVQLVVAAPGVLDGDTDVEGSTLTAAVVTNPANGSLTLNSNGSFTYTPNANYNGTDTFTYRANDGTANSNTATVTITVNAVNDAPVADNDAYSTAENTPLTIAAPGVLDGDTDVEGSTLTAALVAGPANGSLTLNANGSFTYTPNAGFNGPDTFTYRANDGAANSNTATVTITVDSVNDPPVADNDAYATNEDVQLVVPAGTGVLNGDSDPEGLTLTAVLVDTVQHGTLTLNANGSFTYTPAANYNGTDTFTYRANDGVLNSNLATVTLTINAVNDAPVADNDAYATNEDVQLVVAAPGVLDGDTDVEGSTLTAALVAGPANGALTLNSNGSFTYTPNANFNGTDSFTYRANDGAANSNTATVTITVNAVNDAPVADNDAYATNEDVPLVVAAPGVLDGDTDVEGSTLTAAVVTNPTNGALTLNSNGSFTYTPNANYNGTDSFTYRANDGALNSNTATVTLTVNAVNDAPVADNDAYSTNEDVQLVVAAPGVLDGDTDVEGSPLTAAVVAGPANGSLTLNSNGSFTYTPNANYNGTDSFTYRANDGSANSNTATVTITVNAVNDAPVADNEAYTTDEDTPLTVAVGSGVLVGDTDIEGTTLTAVLVDNVQHGTLSLASNGSFVYTPAANYNGTDSFTYRASDGNLSSNLATVTLTINAVNDAPIADADAYATNEDTPLTVAAGLGVLNGDTDVEGSPLTAVLIGDVQHGTLSLATDGSFTYTPAANYNGPDSFTYRASDGSLTSALTTVTLTVNAVNDPPVADDEAYSTNEDTPLTVPAGTGVLVGDTDVEGTTLTPVLVGNVQHGALTLNADGSFTYTPAANYNGTDTFTYRASDGTATSNLATVTLTINAVNDAPVADADSYSVNEDGSLTVPTGTGVLNGDTDVEGSPLTATLADTVQHGSLAFNSDGSFTYTPTANYHGTDTFTYRASDGSLTSALTTVTLTVNPVNDVPTADNDSFTTGEDVPLTVPAATGVLLGDADVDGDPLSAVLVTDVQHGTLVLNSNGSFTYTPAANYFGPDSFTYRAFDGTANSNLATVTLTVDSVNDAPVADNDAYTVLEGGTLTVPAATGVLAGDTDVETPTLTAVLVSGVQHGTLTLNGDGSFTYAPTGNYSGPDSFTYQASDGTATSTVATVSITVTPLNFAPVAQPDGYSVAEDATLTVAAPGVLGNDTDADDDPLTAVLVNNVQHGTLTLNANGSFVYTPAANYHGPDSFTYQADDGTVTSNLVTVSLTVTPVNDAPVAVGETQTTAEDVPLILGAPGVLANDTDIDGDGLTTVPVAGPAHGVLTLNADGSFTYTPATNYNGPDTFTYAVTDGTATTAAVTVNLTVTAVNDAPTPGPDSAALKLKKSVTISVLANDTDPEGNSFSIQSFTQPTKGTVRRVGNRFVYTSTGPLAGADSFTYTVVDSLGAAATGTVTLAITDPVAPTLTAVRARYGVAGMADLKSFGRISLPWAGLTRFDLGFSEDAIPTAGALTLTGPAGAIPLTLATVPAGGAKSAVWSFPALGPGMYTLRLTATEVRDVNGNPLPVNYTRTFGVLPGDFDGNGLVDNRDLTGIKSKYQSNPARADRFADINGDGIVNVVDYNIAKAALGTRL